MRGTPRNECLAFLFMSTAKLFVIKKYVMADSAAHALKKEKRIRADEVWLDDDWKKLHAESEMEKIGFNKK